MYKLYPSNTKVYYFLEYPKKNFRMRIFFSNFLSNVAKYYANCIMFIGNLIDVDSSLFKDNYPILSEDNLKNQENLGGVFYLLSETTIIKNSKFLNNCNFNGGALYINGNKNRALSNLLQSNNEWVNNTAIQNGGAIFFDYDFIILSANLSLELYQHNWAKESNDLMKFIISSIIIKENNNNKKN